MQQHIMHFLLHADAHHMTIGCEIILLLFRPLSILSCIFPEDEHSETVCKAIIDTLLDKSKLIDQWMTVHESMFPNDHHDIPSGSDIHLSKLQFGLITTDTCNLARLLSRLLADEVKSAVEQKKGNLDGSNVIVLTQDCHHHLRNVWIEAVNKRLSSYLNELLASDLSNIDFCLHMPICLMPCCVQLIKSSVCQQIIQRVMVTCSSIGFDITTRELYWFRLRELLVQDMTWQQRERLLSIGIEGTTFLFIL